MLQIINNAVRPVPSRPVSESDIEAAGQPGTPELAPTDPPPASPSRGIPRGRVDDGFRIPALAVRRKEVRISASNARHTLKSISLLLGFWTSGVAFSVAHILYYKNQDGAVVGSPIEQENKIRVGTAFAFLSQISLGAAVWHVYTQMVWISNRVEPESSGRGTQGQGLPLTMETLNNIFGADRSILWLSSLAMLKTFTAGYFIALFAWMLMLPGFFTPGTIFVYDDVISETWPMSVPFLTIAKASFGHNYSYSPDYYGDFPERKLHVTKDFNGPRTIITLLTMAASAGRILTIMPPFNVSSYTVSFNGPTVRCFDADPDTITIIDSVLARKLEETRRGAMAKRITYLGFVPSYDETGHLTPLDTVRYQTSVNASNEVWLAFERYDLDQPGCQSRRHHQVCKLFNSTYHLNLEWHNGFQNITGTTTLISDEPVPYPIDQPPQVSDMVQHAYSAFFWALTDQVTGEFVWYENPDIRNDDSETPKLFGGIQSPIQHNVLLGSSDLNVFFDLNEKPGSCRAEFSSKDRQRQQDIQLARGRTLDVLIEEMAFNMTVSLMHNNGILTRNTTRDVTAWNNVNRYGYSTLGLIVPYGLACGLTTCFAILGLILLIHFGPMPDRDVQDILAAMPLEVLNIAKEPEAHPNFRFGFMMEGRQGEPRRPSVVVGHKWNQRRNRV
ncbi:hypothetical protein V8F20_008548 [Naviculisporaceae sp. PSN 640]